MNNLSLWEMMTIQWLNEKNSVKTIPRSESLKGTNARRERYIAQMIWEIGE